MKKNNVEAGDTFIAYVDDMTSCVGVVTGEKAVRNRYQVVLILGWFTTEGVPPCANVFGHQRTFPFPSYEEISLDDLVPYDFGMEIDLCRSRGGAWWRSIQPPCHTNLVAKHFWPKQRVVLEYVAAAKHHLNGGTWSGYRALDYLDERARLLIWAVLHSHFPDRVARPPLKQKAERSNLVYTVALDTKPPTVTVEIER